MKPQRIIAAGAGAFLAILLGAGTALAGESRWTQWKENLPFLLTGEIEAGGQYVDHRGNSATFDEYRDLDSTGDVFSLRLLGEDKARNNFLEIGGTNLTRTDANYYMSAGRYNYLRFNFEYDRIPHVISHTAQTIYDEPSPGIFQIAGRSVSAAGIVNLTAPPGSTLATALNTVPANPTVAARAPIVNAVNALLRPTELEFQTDNAKFGLSWLPLPELELGLAYNFTTRDGHTPWGTVIGSPGGNVVELAAPRDERFHEFKAGAEYVQDWYQFRFNYTFSLFENDVEKIEWDNPCGSPPPCGRVPERGGDWSVLDYAGESCPHIRRCRRIHPPLLADPVHGRDVLQPVAAGRDLPALYEPFPCRHKQHY